MILSLISEKYANKFVVLLPVGMELFKDFLRTEFSEENVEFWIACEEYKNVKSNKLNARAEEIFSDYVAVQAPREVGLICSVTYAMNCKQLFIKQK